MFFKNCGFYCRVFVIVKPATYKINMMPFLFVVFHFSFLIFTIIGNNEKCFFNVYQNV